MRILCIHMDSPPVATLPAERVEFCDLVVGGSPISVHPYIRTHVHAHVHVTLFGKPAPRLWARAGRKHLLARPPPMALRDVAPVGRPFLLANAQLTASLQHDGSEAAMARVWSKLDAGEPLRIGVLGSSVAMSGGCQAEYQPHLRCAQFDGLQVHKRFARGYGVVDEEMKGLLHNADRPVRGFVLQALDAINASWPHRNHRVVNAAVDAWTAKAIEPCLLSNELITTADLLLLELGSQGWHSSQAVASERIVRKLLARAGGPPPALVLVTTRQWCGRSVHGLKRRERPVLLKTWGGIEDVFARFCAAYGMACLSMRDAIFSDLVAGRANFTVPDVAADCLHPEQSRFGYHYMSDIIIHFLRSSYTRYRSQHLAATPSVRAAAAAARPRALPAALLPSNRGSAGRMVWRCYSLPSAGVQTLNGFDASAASAAGGKIGGSGMPAVQWKADVSSPGAAMSDTASCDALRKCVLRSIRAHDHSCLRGRGHWQHCTRALAPRAVNKPGIVSVLPGAVMRIVVDTMAPVAQHQGNGTGPLTPSLALTYLSSYEHMGVCRVTCESGCTCAPRAIDALQIAQPATSSTSSTTTEGSGSGALARNVSIAAIAEIPVTSARRCVLRFENAPRGGGQDAKGQQEPLHVSKFKLLQVRVGWDLGSGGAGGSAPRAGERERRRRRAAAATRLE